MINFDDWCYHAVAEIRFKPDREAVFRELKNHLEDHYEYLLAQGTVPEKAMTLAMEAMGDPEEIAPQLGKIHKPWLPIFVFPQNPTAYSARMILTIQGAESTADFNLQSYREPGSCFMFRIPPAQSWMENVTGSFSKPSPVPGRNMWLPEMWKSISISITAKGIWWTPIPNPSRNNGTLSCHSEEPPEGGDVGISCRTFTHSLRRRLPRRCPMDNSSQ